MISLRALGCACGGTCGSLTGLGDEGDTGNSSSGGSVFDSVDPGYSVGDSVASAGGYSPSGSGGASGGGINWAAVFAPISQIFSTRYAVPQLNAGQSITRTIAGTQLTQQPAGVAASGASLGLSSTGSLGTLPILLGVGLLVVLLMNKGKG